jgi:hypothetical protein
MLGWEYSSTTVVPVLKLQMDAFELSDADLAACDLAESLCRQRTPASTPNVRQSLSCPPCICDRCVDYGTAEFRARRRRESCHGVRSGAKAAQFFSAGTRGPVCVA